MPRTATTRPAMPKPSTPSRPTPPPQPAPQAKGNFAIHVAEELHEGSDILHPRFGRGTVTLIDTSTSDTKIDVTFNDGQTRKLLLKYARFEIL